MSHKVMIIQWQKAFSVRWRERYLLMLQSTSAQQVRTAIFEYIEIFTTSSADSLLLISASLKFLMHHFHDKNCLTSSLLFLGKVSLSEEQDNRNNLSL